MNLVSGIAETVSRSINEVVSRVRSLETILGVPGAINDSKKFYNQLVFNEGVLQQIVMWTDATMSTKLQTKDFTYINGDLTNITVTRESDQKTMDITIGYTDGSVTSIAKDYA